MGTFLRAFTFGHVRQLESVARQVLTRLSQAVPLLPGAGAAAFVDIDSTIAEVFGHAKQGAGYGYTKVNGLHPLLATVSTPTAAPVICGTRLRAGPAHAARGAGRFVSETLAAARAAGATGTVIARMDAAFYAGAVVSACRAAGARFSITVRMNPSIRAAIAHVDEAAWTPIRYPQAVYDEQAGRWISNAEIAETSYTAFAGTRHETTARLLVRRVKALPRYLFRSP